MPNPTTPDPKLFADRLNATLRARGLDERGINAQLGRTYGARQPTVTHWRQGEYMPKPDKVRAMARDFRVSFEWLYWGEGDAPEFVAGKETASPEERVLHLESLIAALCVWIRETIPTGVPSLIEHVEAAGRLAQADPVQSVFGVALDGLGVDRTKHPIRASHTNVRPNKQASRDP